MLVLVLVLMLVLALILMLFVKCYSVGVGTSIGIDVGVSIGIDVGTIELGYMQVLWTCKNRLHIYPSCISIYPKLVYKQVFWCKHSSG